MSAPLLWLCQLGYRHLEPFEHGAGVLDDQRNECSTCLVQSLTQPLCRRDSADTQRLLEVLVIPLGGDGLIIALPKTQQAEVTADNVDLGNVIAPLAHAAKSSPQVTVVIDARANQSQAGVAGVEFVVALLEDEPLHIFTCQVGF